MGKNNTNMFQQSAKKRQQEQTEIKQQLQIEAEPTPANDTQSQTAQQPKATKKQPRTPKQGATAADQSKAAEPKPAETFTNAVNAIQYAPLFADYGVPSKLKGAKSRRVQLLLYPETYDRAAEVATALNVSLNDLAAAAISRLCDDYSKKK